MRIAEASGRCMYTSCRDLSPVQTADVIGRFSQAADVTTRRGFAQVSDHSVPRSGKRHSSHHLRLLSFLFIKTHVHTIHYALRNLHLREEQFIFGRRGVIGSECASEAAPYVNSRDMGIRIGQTSSPDHYVRARRHGKGRKC